MILLNKLNLKTILLSCVFTTGLVQHAQAASTMVTDAIGTQELWTFTEVLGAQKLTSKINQVDSKGVVQTWDANGNMLTRTDAEGRLTTYTYNATNQKTSMTEADGTSEARVTTYTYVNADIDIVTSTTSPSIYASNSKSVVNTYDANLNITDVTVSGFDASGSAVTRATTFDHDVYGKVTEIDGPRTDVSDITTLVYYDCNTGAECGQLQSVTNALGHTTIYDLYDGAARLLQSTNANGVVTTYTYHPRGWMLSMTQTPPTGSARLTTYEYDNVGQLIKTTQPDGSEQNYVYDAAHDLREIYDNLGNKVTYTYDAKGNRTDELVYDPDDTLVRSTITSYDIRNYIESINNGGSVTQLINDAVGNLSNQTDPNLNPSTDHSFDALDRLTNTIDALTNDTDYIYNVADQLTQVSAPNGAITQYQYDDLGNQTQEISPDRGTLVYTHDDAGNVTSMTDARAITANYSYDALNRLTNITYPSSSENISYTYDAACLLGVGRLCQSQDDSGITDYSYDAWGNVISTSKDERDASDASLGLYVTDYQYDAANRVVQVTYPSGRIVDTSRDVIGRLVGVTTTDTDSQTTSLITNRVYQADGLWTQQDYGNGLVQIKSYDLQGRLADHTAGAYSRQYGYDANGNILDMDTTDNSYERDYGYDVLDRLTQTSNIVDSVLRDFTYDPNGNREQMTENSATSTLNYTANTNRLADIDGNNLSIDPSGRTLADDLGRNYTYNDAGRLTTITINSQVIGEYTYNNQQLRTQKSAAGATTIYHYDLAGNMLAETDEQGNTKQEYVYADGERIATFAPSSGSNTGDPIDLSGHVTYGGGQDNSSTGTIDLSNANKTIAVNGNRWRAIPFNYTVTTDTVIEFDFSSNSLGEIHGIGLDDNLSISNNRTFQLYGTQSWGINAFKTYSGSGTQHFVIPVGQFYQGAMNYIGLTMDHDSGASGQSVFSDIKIYEAAPTSTAGIIDLTNVQSYGGGQDQTATGSVTIDGDGALNIQGNRWQKLHAPITLTPTMELQFEFKSDTQGEIHGIGVDNDNGIGANQTFAVWGTQNWGNRSAYGYSGAGAYQSYSIPIGQILTGSFNYLTFTMDDDANKVAQSVFRNVQFVDPANPPTPTAQGVQYYVNDHLGTPQQLLDDSEVVTWAADYEAFGEATLVTEAVVNNHRFPGQYFDVESGLHYNWNRYYDAGVGRYVSSDPIGLGGGLNTFGYAYQNSIRMTDPTGLRCIHIDLLPTRDPGLAFLAPGPWKTVDWWFKFGYGGIGPRLPKPSLPIPIGVVMPIGPQISIYLIELQESIAEVLRWVTITTPFIAFCREKTDCQGNKYYENTFDGERSEEVLEVVRDDIQMTRKRVTQIY